MIGNVLVVDKNLTLVKNCFEYFLGNFWKYLGYFLLQTSGHTGGNEKERE